MLVAERTPEAFASALLGLLEDEDRLAAFSGARALRPCATRRAGRRPAGTTSFPRRPPRGYDRSSLRRRRAVNELLLLLSWSVALASPAAAARERPRLPPRGLASRAARPGRPRSVSRGRPSASSSRPGTPTHYVDNTHPSATDSSNPRARPARRGAPCLRAGRGLGGGGARRALNVSRTTWGAHGSAAAPCSSRAWDRRSSGGTRARSRGGSYLVVEGLVLEGAAADGAGAIKLAIRRNEIRNYPDGPTAMIRPPASPTPWSSAQPRPPLRRHPQDRGDGHLGRRSSTTAQNVWVVDNHIHHIAGDSVAWATSDRRRSPGPFVYIGRNDFHHNQENALDIKQSRDVVVSENRITGYRPPQRLDDGKALVVHDDPESVWILGNQSTTPRTASAARVQDGLYVIGNVIWDIKHEPGDEYDPRSMGGVQAIRATATPDFYAINNTVYVRRRHLLPDGAHGEIVNNIVAGLTESSHHVAVGNRASANVLRNNVFDAARASSSGRRTVRDCGDARSSFPNQVDRLHQCRPALRGRRTPRLQAGRGVARPRRRHGPSRLRQVPAALWRRHPEGPRRPNAPPGPRHRRRRVRNDPVM